MARALQLAQRGRYITSPNPTVGCVIVRDGQILGEGSTRPAGQNHGEIEALAAARVAQQDVRGATAYVTLEPCSHQGRTPPCAEALVAAGLGRVVAAMQDPNPLVAGRGLARLQAAGIETQCGLLETEAREMNLGFVARMTRGRPWLRLKLAASLDGKTALQNGQSQWITGPAARVDGHHWRARACAILTGIGTVRDDDPRFTVRGVDYGDEQPRQPLRVVVDSRLEISQQAQILQGGNVLIATAQIADAAQSAGQTTKITALQALGAEIVCLPNKAGKVDLSALMTELGRRGCNEVHGEAGFKLSGSLLRAGLVDEFLLYLAPVLLGDQAAGMFHWPALTQLADGQRLHLQDVRRLGEDIRILARCQ